MSIENYTYFLLNNKNRIISLWLIILLAFSSAIVYRLLTVNAIIDNSVGVWFDLNDSEVKTYDKHNTAFGSKEWTVLLLETDSIYDNLFLYELDKTTKSIEQLDHVIKVTSITNVRDNWISASGELDYRVLYDTEYAAGNHDFIEKFKDKLLSNPIFDNNLINKDNDKYTAILIQNDNFLKDPTSYRTELIDNITEVIGRNKTVNNWGLAGTTVVIAELNRASLKDVLVFYTLVSFFLTLISWFMLKNIKDLVVVLSVVLTSVLSAMGLLAVLDIAYNMATVMLPPILIALSVAGVIHIITDFHYENEDKAATKAIIDSLSVVFRPAIWTSLTTIVGFGAFSVSSVYPIFQLGTFAAFGIFVAMLSSISIAPILLWMMWNQEKKAKKNVAFTISPENMRFYRYPLVIWGALLALSIPISGLYYMEVDTDYSKFFDKEMKVSKSYDMLEKAGFGQNPVLLSIKLPQNSEFTDEHYSSSIRLFENAVKDIPEVIKLLSVNDFIDELDDAFNGTRDTIDQQNRGFSKEALSQLFLLAELSGNDDIDDLIVDSKQQIQTIVMTSYFSSKALKQFRDKINALQSTYLSKDIEVDVTGTTVLWANMDTQVTKTQIQSLLIIGVFLIILLPIIFKSVWLGLLGIIINFLPLAATVGLMSWFDIKINMATVILGAISIGIVVDDTIHMFSRIQLYRQLGMAWKEATEKSITTIGTSIYRTTLILVAAFACMATSDFLPTSHFGLFVSISVVIALFLDLFVAPLLLIGIAEWKTKPLSNINEVEMVKQEE